MKKSFMRRVGAAAIAFILSISCLSLPAFASGGDGNMGDLAQRAAGVATAPTYDIWQVFTGEIDQDFLETTGETQLMGLCYGANAKSCDSYVYPGWETDITVVPGQPLSRLDLLAAQSMYYLASVDTLTEADKAFMMTQLFVDLESAPFKSGLTLEQVNTTTVPTGWYVITSCTMGTTGSEGTVARCFGNYEISSGSKVTGSFLVSDGSLNYVPKSSNASLTKEIVSVENGDVVPVALSDDTLGNTAFVALGDIVTFRLTATLPDNIASYHGFMADFVDFLPYGFDLDFSSIEVSFPDSDDELLRSSLPVLDEGAFYGLKTGYAAAEFDLPASANRDFYEHGLEVTVSRLVSANHAMAVRGLVQDMVRTFSNSFSSLDGIEKFDANVLLDNWPSTGEFDDYVDELESLLDDFAELTPSLGSTCVVEYSGTVVDDDDAPDGTMPIISAANENIAQLLWSADPYEMARWNGSDDGPADDIMICSIDVTQPTVRRVKGVDVVRPQTIACTVDAVADIRTAGLTIHIENAAGNSLYSRFRLERVDGRDFVAVCDYNASYDSDDSWADGDDGREPLRSMPYYYNGDTDSIKTDIHSIRSDIPSASRWEYLRFIYDGRYPVDCWDYDGDAPATVGNWANFYCSWVENDLIDIRNDYGWISLYGLGPGEYVLTPIADESAVGYNDLPIVEFELAMRDDGEIYVVGSELGDGSPSDYINTAVSADSWIYINYVMTSGIMLPVTGGTGTNMLLIGGVSLVALAGVVYFMMRKRRAANI